MVDKLALKHIDEKIKWAYSLLNFDAAVPSTAEVQKECVEAGEFLADLSHRQKPSVTALIGQRLREIYDYLKVQIKNAQMAVAEDAAIWQLCNILIQKFSKGT